MTHQVAGRSHAGRTTSQLPRGGAALLMGGLCLPAWAHHPMDGVVPTNVWHGLLSGLAHPVIGPDHLAFLVAAALLAAWSGVRGWRGVLLAVAFVGAGAVGTLLRRPGVELPFAEAGVALTLLAIALALLWQGRAAAWSTLGFTVAAGGLHGWAYGEAVIGAEATPLGAYIFALVIAQAGLMALCHRFGVWLARTVPTGIPRARQVAAALSAIVGLLAISGALGA